MHVVINVERDRCHPNPCRHGGVCEVEHEDAVCTCNVGWSGATCEGKHIYPV